MSKPKAAWGKEIKESVNDLAETVRKLGTQVSELSTKMDGLADKQMKLQDNSRPHPTPSEVVKQALGTFIIFTLVSFGYVIWESKINDKTVAEIRQNLNDIGQTTKQISSLIEYKSYAVPDFAFEISVP